MICRKIRLPGVQGKCVLGASLDGAKALTSHLSFSHKEDNTILSLGGGDVAKVMPSSSRAPLAPNATRWGHQAFPGEAPASLALQGWPLQAQGSALLVESQRGARSAAHWRLCTHKGALQSSMHPRGTNVNPREEILGRPGFSREIRSVV